MFARSAPLQVLAFAAMSALAACSDAKPNARASDAGAANLNRNALPPAACVPDASAPVPADRCAAESGDASALPPCEKWVAVEPDGAVCSDGSQYKFFVNYSNRSNNLVVMFEPGGACWDFASCSGSARGAANPHGIPDDHMSNYQYLNLLRRTDDNPLRDWNMVFVSYCTGDVHTGAKVATYQDPNGGPPLTYRHAGHADTLSAIAWLQQTFPTIPQLMVTGCSAGGIGALTNYALIRSALSGAQCGYLLDDSGPLFHSDGFSKQLHQTIREAWNLDSVLSSVVDDLPITEAELTQDYARLNTALADKYPSDRLALSLYRMDFNYSLYSYETFFPDATESDIHSMWWQDVQALMATYDTRPNLAYYIPYFRRDNCSHCVSIPPIDHDTTTILDMPWLGSEIAADNIDLKGYVSSLIDDSQPLRRYVEDARPDEQFSSDESQMCLNDG